MTKKKEIKKDSRPKSSSRSIRKLNFIDERNVIKKVKTYAIKNIFTILFELIEKGKNYDQLYNIFHKNLFLKIFKTDISKNRNKLILNTKIRIILEKLLNLKMNIFKDEINESRMLKFNFLLNSTWKEFLIMLTNNSLNNIFRDINKEKCIAYYVQLTRLELSQYLNYVDIEFKQKKDRIYLNPNYLQIYDSFVINDEDEKELDEIYNCIDNITQYIF